MKANVTPKEEATFNKYPLPVRQQQYARRMVEKTEGLTVTALKEQLKWKFGKCCLTVSTLQSILR